jgi:hypothetical protein
VQWDAQHATWNFDVRVGPIFTEWLKGGETNICYNALDRHVAAGRGGHTAFLFEGNEPGQRHDVTYQEVLDHVCRVVRLDVCLRTVACTLHCTWDVHVQEKISRNLRTALLLRCTFAHALCTICSAPPMLQCQIR